MGLLGILLALALLMWLAFRGWSVLLVAPAAALLGAAMSGEPLLAHWTQTFMGSASRFVAQWFPLFLLGGLFGKLMDDSGSITSIAGYLTDKLGTQRAMLSVVLASAVVTYGGVSVFVAFFVLVPMAQKMFRAADIPRRLMPATICLGAFTFTMSALPGSPSINNAIPMPYFGTTPFAAPGLGIIASIITMAFGMWWLGRAEAARKPARDMAAVLTLFLPSTRRFVSMRRRQVRLDPAEIRSWQPRRRTTPSSLVSTPLVLGHCHELRDVAAGAPTPRLFRLLAEEWAGAGPRSGAVAGTLVGRRVPLAVGTLTVIVHQLPPSLPALRREHGCRCQFLVSCRS